MRDLSAYTVTRVGSIRSSHMHDLFKLSAHEIGVGWNYHLPERYQA